MNLSAALIHCKLFMQPSYHLPNPRFGETFLTQDFAGSAGVCSPKAVIPLGAFGTPQRW